MISTYKQVKKVLLAAGIRFTEAAVLFGVNRQTLYNWEETPEVFELSKHFDETIRMTNLIQDKIYEGDLPLPPARASVRIVKLRDLLGV